jgi:hypothetical protein
MHRDNLDEWRTAIRRLSEIPEVWDNYAAHPWAGANINVALYTIEQRDQLVEVINKLRRTIQQIETISAPVSSRLGLRKIACLDDCEKLLVILKVLEIACLWWKHGCRWMLQQSESSWTGHRG